MKNIHRIVLLLALIFALIMIIGVLVKNLTGPISNTELKAVELAHSTKNQVSVVTNNEDDVRVDVEKQSKMREMFDRSISEMLVLAEGKDVMALFERMTEPESEGDKRLKSWRKGMKYMSESDRVAMLEPLEMKMTWIADWLRDLDVTEDELKEGTFVVSWEEAKGSKMSGEFYEVDGVWYMRMGL